MKSLCVPTNWPLAWWSANGSQIKMSCPTCGGFSLLMTRDPDIGVIRSLACEGCGLAGLEPVQAAMDAWATAHAEARAQDQASLDDARLESDRAVAEQRQRTTRTAKAA